MTINEKILFEEKFHRKFRKVHREIDFLRNKMHKKTGFLFFKSHVYSIEELLESEHHSKIYAITEKIGDDALNWYRAGNLNEEGISAYREERNDIEDELDQVNSEIQNREPTWWEEVKEPFVKFIRVVMKNLPDLIPTMLGGLLNILRLPSPIRTILRLPMI